MNNSTNVCGGYGAFNTSQQLYPQRLFHLYSDNVTYAFPSNQEAFLRLQTNVGPTTSGVLRPQFAPTGIEFFAGQVNGIEEQLSSIQSCQLDLAANTAYPAIYGNNGNPRGLDILSMKPATNGFLAAGNQVRGLRILTAEIDNPSDPNNPRLMKPRVGIGTDAPREMLQIGERFTFHSQGSDVIGHNIYYDTYAGKSKRIDNHPAAAIAFWEGIITIGTVGLDAANTDVEFADWGNNKLQGMTILPIGGNAHVGIGVTYPGARLDVRGVTNNGSSSAFRVMNSDQTTLFQIFDHGAVSIGAPASPSPGKMLQVAGDAQMGAITSTALIGAIGSAARPLYADANGTLTTSGSPVPSGWTLTGNSGTSSQTNFLGTTDNQPLVIKTANTPRMTVFGDGRVLIFGTNSTPLPASLLDIQAPAPPTGTNHISVFRILNSSGDERLKISQDGYVVAQDFKVALRSNNNQWTWPDYVFSTGYNLLTLNEVEQFISDNGHLPGVPSAKEIEQEGGVEIGKMQVKLLQKVEELTLYVLELNNENKAMKAKLATLLMQRKGKK